MKSVRRHPLAWFFALAYAFSWLFWLPASAAAVQWIDPVPSTLLHFVGGSGPMISAVLVSTLTNDRPALDRLWNRSVTGGAWILIAILIPATLFVISAFVVARLYGTPVAWGATGVSSEAPSLPRPVYWLANLLFYRLGRMAPSAVVSEPDLRLVGSADRPPLQRE